MPRVRLTITESRCRAGHHAAGDVFVVEDLCPPVCHELWSGIYHHRYLPMMALTRTEVC